MGKIFIVESEWMADSKVYIVDAEWKADSKEFVVSDEWKADEKVYIVDAEWKADRKIFLVDTEWKANKSASDGYGFSSASNTSAKENSKNSRTAYIKTLLSRSAAFEASNSNSSSSRSNSGCGGTIVKWIIFLTMIGAVLKYFGLTDKLMNDTKPSKYKVIADSLNLRSSPDPNSTVVSIIPRDSVLIHLKDSSQEVGTNTWIYVTNKMDSGWVNEKYVEKK